MTGGRLIRGLMFALLGGLLSVVGAALLRGADKPAKKLSTFDASKLPLPAGKTVDFVHDVRPLFESHCWKCHGDQRHESGFNLQHGAAALAGGDIGRDIQPGKSAESRLVQFASGLDSDERMPPDGEGTQLSTEEVGLLRAWIDQGAKWPKGADVVAAAPTTHWAYQKPVRPPLPKVKHASWPRNEIDYFILARLEQEGLAPAAEEDRARLIRRVSLDLIGLPPTPEEVDAFVADTRPDAYERVVDRLLASPHYGERWARPWLDLARYADTQGYEKDPRRSMWPYRDWVINALNRNLPFDQFTIEQLAGDLLPNATNDDRIATGFHRNTMINTEGGVDPEEYRVLALIDRVNTTATVWLGTTLGCCQCHSHKYDPFKQTEYYQFLAFFNNTADSGSDNGPEVELSTPAAVADRAEIARLEAHLNAITSNLARAQMEWEQSLKSPNSPGSRAAKAVPIPQLIATILAVPADQRTPAQKDELLKYFRSIDPALLSERQRLEKLRKKLAEERVTTLVMQELPSPRQSHIFTGGSFLNPGDVVTPGIPAVLNPLKPAAGQPLNRLALAKWLVEPANPLTARVAVNRFWAQHFGVGLVATVEDFGTKGERPSHPELLDWLATEFVRRGWDMKAMQRLIVTSATYRQSSRIAPASVERDPQGRLLSRFPRNRLEAELVRDQALAISGLLSPKIGGPSVMPPQPDGVWSNPYSGDRWATSAGADRYRRGLYTFWKRTSPYPEFTNFDAPSREFCVARRPRTNTPLQALTVLNDPVYIEAAQSLARRMMREVADDPPARVRRGFLLVLARSPKPAELERLLSLYRHEMAYFSEDGATAKAMAGSAAAELKSSELAQAAAWTVVANVLLNLDETLNLE